VAVAGASPRGSASSMSRGSLVVDHCSLPPRPLGPSGTWGAEVDRRPTRWGTCGQARGSQFRRGGRGREHIYSYARS
jgi:hypothetical protein